jgi:hypothetical protein
MRDLAVVMTVDPRNGEREHARSRRQADAYYRDRYSAANFVSVVA